MERYPEETLHSPEELANFLLYNDVDSTTVQILKDEGITGSTLMDVNEGDLKELYIKMGPRKKLLQIINRYKAQAPKETVNSVLVDTDEAIEFGTEHCERQISEILSAEPKSSSSDTSIRKWLEQHPQGKRLTHVFENEIYTPEDRCLLVRIVIAEMIKICGSAYPSSEKKDEMARAIISEFPCLKSTRADTLGHEHFYDKDSGTGFLEYRLKTVRKNLSPSKKRRRVGFKKTTEMKKIDSVLSKEDLEEKVIWMKLTNPTDYHKTAITEVLEETRPDRRIEIMEGKPTITDILERFPRLRDYNGEMIEREFKWLHPDAVDLLRIFSFYGVRILKYVESKKPQLMPLVSGLDDNFKALVLLPELLPVANYNKKRKTQVKNMQKNYFKILPHPHLIKFVNANENFNMLDEIATQPHILCPRLGGVVKQYFLKLDSLNLEVADNVVTAFDLLFKAHFVFNVEYAQDLQNFYNFVAGCLYKIVQPNPSSDALNSSLLNVPVDVAF